ncbi:16S rRNA (adenine(1518)-N(6)/adenine(1519)-N(6))-dimethyltransferase RsmA [Salibacter halophilus]|uniref:Ribosomal RNA small subunit methyltransferase A n=1 Tax=Salibacter halophilus TaxID=1803916 RepID=A0A6N6M4T2_9FLAO|nr:16S rRNA (adenine(1518)-N(6)/adenine(1519)-N(6))-dimethyltransferase RsmA [Salibacter halophilus]KAB1063364.1 16S rRNA (adenine(1518)-N(6)/adenine(1519)-N(6))-dimethyltransferase RsmA [Salibacter halophilus]
MTKRVRPKKFLGQHFLKDLSVAKRIADSLSLNGYKRVLEVGPGMGVLTKFLLERPLDLTVIELDRESVPYLRNHFPELEENIIEGDFLRFPVDQVFKEQFALIGNYPYNISSQILFKALEHRDLIVEVGGMFQREVAQRVASKPGSKVYGVISVLIQAYYDVEYLFTVDEGAFNPPPKVKSGVILLRRKENQNLGCDEKLFKRVVKMSFNQRRKTIRNSLKALTGKEFENEFLKQRPEQLSVDDFVKLTREIEKLQL